MTGTPVASSPLIYRELELANQGCGGALVARKFAQPKLKISASSNYKKLQDEKKAVGQNLVFTVSLLAMENLHWNQWRLHR